MSKWVDGMDKKIPREAGFLKLKHLPLEHICKKVLENGDIKIPSYK